MSVFKKRSTEQTILLLRRLVLISALFALVLSVMIVVNYIQLKRSDPLNTKAMTVMLERLKSTPEDDQLREEIRALDLVARKAFFTSQWQIRAGGYLLLISILLVVGGMKGIDLLRKTLPDIPSSKKEDFWGNLKISRRWIAISGSVLAITTLLLAFLSHHQMGRTLDEMLISEGVSYDSVRGSSPSPGSQETPGSQALVLSRIGDSAGVSMTTADSGKAGQMSDDGYPTQTELLRNFTTFRGPGGLGIAPHRNIPTAWDGKSGKNIRWKSPVPLPGFNSPILWNDRVFVSGASESLREVYCFDANNGALLWKTAIEKIPGSPAKAPKVIGETGYAAPTMTTDGRRVYAIFANGDLVALDLNGKQVWSKNLGVPVNHYGHSSSLIMHRDLLIVQYDQRGAAAVMAFSGRTGDLAWKSSRNVKVSWASPVLMNTGKQAELLLAAEPAVVAYNPSNGAELWRMDCISGEVGPSLAYADGVVYSVNEYSKLAAIQIGEAPKLLWEDSEYLSDVPSPVATEKFLFLATSYGTMVCYDAKTGEKYWEHEFDRTVYASPMLAEGRIYLLDKNGVMHIFSAGGEFSLTGEPALGEGSFCTPAFADGRIYIRGDKNLYCIGK